MKTMNKLNWYLRHIGNSLNAEFKKGDLDRLVKELQTP